MDNSIGAHRGKRVYNRTKCPSPGCDFDFLHLFCVSHLKVVPPIECELLHVAFKAWMLLEGPVALYLVPNVNLNEA